MKVKELIEVLEAKDGEAEVWLAVGTDKDRWEGGDWIGVAIEIERDTDEAGFVWIRGERSKALSK